jgi:hypothetical protein
VKIETLCKLINPTIDRDEQIESPIGWESYGNVTHVEACKRHAEKFPWRRSVMVTRRVGEQMVFTHHIAREVKYNVKPLRRRES